MHSADADSEPDALFRRIADGDQEAFAMWYDATAASVFGIVLRVLRDRAQAEEVTQEVYVEAWRLAGRYDPAQGSSRSWLHTIAHRRAVDRVRSSQRRADREQRHVALAADPPPAGTAEVAIAHEEGRRVREALAGLPDAQREALVLAYFDGRSHREVSEVLGIPLGTAKTRIRDALRRLRGELGEAAP